MNITEKLPKNTNYMNIDTYTRRILEHKRTTASACSPFIACLTFSPPTCTSLAQIGRPIQN